MNSTEDPLETNDMLKLATIYRNSECTYVYVCYHCRRSFLNISDTLSHVECHFDKKVDIVDVLIDKLSEIVEESSELVEVIKEHVEIVKETSALDEVIDEHVEIVKETTKSDEVIEEHVEIVEQTTELDEVEEHVDQVTLSDDNEPVEFQPSTSAIVTIIPPSLQCSFCDQTFFTSPLLSIHLIKDHVLTSTLYKCPQCPQRCSDESTFLRHLQAHGNVKDKSVNDVTPNCTQTSATVKAVKHQRPKYKKSFLWTCKICSMKFSNREQVISHMVKKHKKKKTTLHRNAEAGKDPWTKYQMKFLKTCDICSSQFANKRKLVLHMQEKHMSKKGSCNVRIFDCDKCSQQISGKFNFYAHQYGHLTNGDRMNEVDEKTLRQNLQNFLDDNVYCDESSPDKPFGCRICSYLSSPIRRTAEVHVLQRHVFYVKPNEPDSKKQCEHCGLKLSNSSNLSQHLQLHTKERPYSCPICSKTFTIKRYVKMHMRTHSDAAPEQCPTCGKTFRTFGQLNIHIRTHSDAMAKCQICDREVKSYRLKQHLQDVHENEHRPYSCSVCLQTFKSSKTLRNHSFRHTGERRHECRFHCKEKFISSAARRAHERSKHEAQ